MSSKLLCRIVLSALVAVVLVGAGVAHADCHCVSIAADVGALGKPKAELGDNLYASGKFAEALAAYAEGWAAAKETAFLYAQAMCQWQLGAGVEARALFQQYLAAGGKAGLEYGARAQSALTDLAAGIPAVVGAGVAVGTKVGGQLTGELASGVDGGMDGIGGIGGGVAAGYGAGANLAADVSAKPKKVAKGAAVVLGVVAVGAIAAVGIQGIAAGIEDDIDFDYKFGIGMGVAGVSVGVTAIYLYGLTAATGAAPGLRCASRKPVVAPAVFAHGGGMAAAFTF
jgi:hypothetical protein